MRPILRYLPIATRLVRTSIQTQAQYRFDFLLQLLMTAFWVAWNVAPFLLIFGIRPTIAGWTREQAMLVMSFFLILRALIEGVVSPNLNNLVSQIRTGTFDFVLLKPVDAQLLASLSRVVPYRLVDLTAGIAIASWAISRLDPAPPASAIGCGLLMLLAGAATIYAVWLLISCTAFWFVKVDNLAFLFGSIFDAARWPITLFRGVLRTILTSVVPIAIMTSYPALAVLGQLSPLRALIAWATALGLMALARVVWQWAIRHYSSASS